MPVQRTREEEEKLHLQVLHNGNIIMQDAAEKLKKIWDRVAQLEDKKTESKK